MDIEYLRDDELSYELRIRNCDLTGTVQDKRFYLQGLLQLETMNASSVNASLLPEPMSELQTCCAKLQEMISTISGFNNTSESDLKHFDEECNARLLHVQQRILRLPLHLQSNPIKLLAAAKSCLHELVESFKSCPTANLIELDNVETTCPVPMISPNDRCRSLINRLNSIRFEHPLPTNTAYAHNNPQSTPVLCANPSHTVQTAPVLTNHFSNRVDNSQPVSRWNIKFNGTSGVNEFLERVQEYAFARGVSDEQLFRQASDLFCDDALSWFRWVRSSINSWSELTARLRSAFLPHNYDLALQDEIRSRTQGPNEKSEIYIAKMENLFGRLSNKPDETTRLAAIRHNLQPHYQRLCSLQPINSIQDLVMACKLIEDTEAYAASFRNPPARNSSLLEPDLAYNRPARPVKVETLTSRPVVCWNCQKTGHLYYSCKDPLGIFCRGCGRRNTYRPNCPKCSKNDSHVSGLSAAGNGPANKLTTPTGQSG